MVEEKHKLSQIQEGFVQVVEASKEATKRVRQLNLAPDPPVLEDSCRSLPAVAEFIAKVAADIQVFKSNNVTQLSNDKNTAIKHTAALVMVAFREANPGATIPDFLTASPPTRSIRAVNTLASALAKKTFPPL